MSGQSIRYFGSTIAFGEDCEPLSDDHAVMVFEGDSHSEDLRSIADMVHHRDHLKTPVSYVVLPFRKEGRFGRFRRPNPQG